MATKSNGDLAAADYFQGTVTIFRAGLPIRTVAGFNRPHDVAYDSKGNLYVAEFGRDVGESRVARIDAVTGEANHSWATGFVGLGGIAAAPDDAMWVADSDGRALYRISTDGTPTKQACDVCQGDFYIHGLRFDANGNLFMVNTVRGEVIMRTNAGRFEIWAQGLTWPVAVLPDGGGGLFVAQQTLDGSVVQISALRDTETLIQLVYPSGLALQGRTLYVGSWDPSALPWKRFIYLASLPLHRPRPPQTPVAEQGDGAATISWRAPIDVNIAGAINYTVSASPGGQSCTTSGLSCVVAGLTNRQNYTFTVVALNEAGSSNSSSSSNVVMPLAPGFQTWAREPVSAIGSSTTLNLAQASPSASIAVTGAVKASVTATSSGFAALDYTATKSGIQKFTASYSVKVGKKTTKYTATTQLYVPAVSGPMLKIKTGKTGKFSIQFMPPGAAVSIALTDGRTNPGIADAAGKATFTPTFSIKGAVNYSVSVAGVQVATGGLTVI